MKNIILGTAQFGLDYGITNKYGRLSFDQIISIANFSFKNGIDTLDTAADYGASEDIISGLENFKIITKINFQKEKELNFAKGEVFQRITDSLRRLKRAKIYAVLLHNSKLLLSDNSDIIVKELEEAKHQGLIEKYGVSVYSPNDTNLIIDKYNIDLIQLPLNVFDQRFLVSGCLDMINKRNIEVHARSIFLQGSLLASKTPSKLIKWDKKFVEFRRRCEELKLSQLQYCLAFANQNLFNGSSIVLGVTSVSELGDIIKAKNIKIIKEDWQGWAYNDDNLINPTKWL